MSSSADGDAKAGALAYAEALRMLSRRARSEADLRQRLCRKGCAPAAIDHAVQRCRHFGYVDDRRLALNRAGTLMRSGRAVGVRLLHELKKEGLAPELAAQAMEQCRDELCEQQLLNEVMERRAAGLDFSSLDERQRRRLISYLQRRGFSLSMILNSIHDKERQN